MSSMSDKPSAEEQLQFDKIVSLLDQSHPNHTISALFVASRRWKDTERWTSVVREVLFKADARDAIVREVVEHAGPLFGWHDITKW